MVSDSFIFSSELSGSLIAIILLIFKVVGIVALTVGFDSFSLPSAGISIKLILPSLAPETRMVGVINVLQYFILYKI